MLAEIAQVVKIKHLIALVFLIAGTNVLTFAATRYWTTEHALTRARERMDAALKKDDQLDIKWDVAGKDLLRRIRQLPGESRRTIVVGVVEFWEKSACGKDEEVLHWILDEVNTARITAKTW